MENTISPRGLPGVLEEEVYALLVPVIRRYAVMRKRHLGQDRMEAIVLRAVRQAINEVWEAMSIEPKELS